MPPKHVYSRNYITNEKYLWSKIPCLLYFRTKIKSKIALCKCGHVTFDKTFENGRNKLHKDLQACEKKM